MPERLCDACYVGSDGAVGAYYGSVAMANYAHCEVDGTSVAYRLDDDGDEAHDLAMLPSTLAEYALQIEPFRFCFTKRGEQMDWKCFFLFFKLIFVLVEIVFEKRAYIIFVYITDNSPMKKKGVLSFHLSLKTLCCWDDNTSVTGTRSQYCYFGIFSILPSYSKHC